MPWEKTGKNEWMYRAPAEQRASREIFDQAVDLLHDGNMATAERAFRRIVQEYPRWIEGYHYLSLIFDATDRPLEAYLSASEAVRIGISELPSAFRWQNAHLSWYVHENRPFMRAYHHLGLLYQQRGEHASAIEVFSRLLSICPTDNLGVRYLLPKSWLAQGDTRSVILHCEAFSDDGAPEILYTHPLALVMGGRIKEAKLLLKGAKHHLPLVAKELLKKRHTRPKKTSMYITLGGTDQAYLYWQHYGEFWKQTPQALQLLAEL